MWFLEKEELRGEGSNLQCHILVKEVLSWVTTGIITHLLRDSLFGQQYMPVTSFMLRTPSLL